MIKLISKISIIHILILSFILRFLAFYFFSDENLTNEWAKIIHNKEISGVFGYYVVVNDYFAEPKFAKVGEIVLPSVFMPPLYYFFIYTIKTIFSGLFNITFFVILIQIFISLASIYIFYKIVRKFEEKNISLLTTCIFSFFPLNVWVVSQISSITLQIFLILNFFMFLLKYQEESGQRTLILFSIFSGLLILIRGEFFLFYFFTLIYFFIFLRKDFKALILSVIITILIISPYLYRNYNLLNTITLTKSFGYNLLKGNNPNLKIEGDAVFLEETFKRENLNIKTTSNYEIKLDDFYKNQAVKYILDDPLKYSKFYLKKVVSFLFIDINSTYPNYYNMLHLLPKIILSVLTLIGSFLLIKSKGFFQYLTIYYFCNIFLFSIFFILPRYSLILLPIQILMSTIVIKYSLRKLMN
tara:strand:- start:1293 stop:2531 length:1239 start_codon:yes stop_codon:yes gene_type:complete